MNPPHSRLRLRTLCLHLVLELDTLSAMGHPLSNTAFFPHDCPGCGRARLGQDYYDACAECGFPGADEHLVISGTRISPDSQKAINRLLGWLVAFVIIVLLGLAVWGHLPSVIMLALIVFVLVPLNLWNATHFDECHQGRVLMFSHYGVCLWHKGHLRQIIPWDYVHLIDLRPTHASLHRIVLLCDASMPASTFVNKYWFSIAPLWWRVNPRINIVFPLRNESIAPIRKCIAEMRNGGIPDDAQSHLQ